MKIYELLNEMPIIDKDGKYTPIRMQAENTPSVENLDRLFNYIGRFSPKNSPSALKIDLWLAKQRHRAWVTLPPEGDQAAELNLADSRARVTQVAEVQFRELVEPIPVENILHVKGVFTDELYRGSFMAGSLYIFLAQAGNSIVSDTLQFLPGKALWKRLSRIAGMSGFLVRVWSLKTHDWLRDQEGEPIAYDAENISEEDIWQDIKRVGLAGDADTTVFVLTADA